MSKDFKPILIGRYEETINEDSSRWIGLIEALNRFIDQWNNYFSCEIQLNEVLEIIKVNDFTFYLKSKYVHQSPKHSEFLKSLDVIIEQFVKTINFPDFKSVVESHAEMLNAVKKWRTRGESWSPKIISLEGFELWAEKIFVDGKFVLTTELQESIEQKSSIYTKNLHENYALSLVQEICNSLNVLQDLGASISLIELPTTFRMCVETTSSKKKYAELKFHSDQDNHTILNFKPAKGMFNNGCPVLRCTLNLTEEEIMERLITEQQPLKM